MPVGGLGTPAACDVRPVPVRQYVIIPVSGMDTIQLVKGTPISLEGRYGQSSLGLLPEPYRYITAPVLN